MDTPLTTPTYTELNFSNINEVLPQKSQIEDKSVNLMKHKGGVNKNNFNNHNIELGVATQI